MTVEVVPILSDNYVFLLKNANSPEVCIVDPGESAPILEVLATQNLKPTTIFLTHHHNDHIGGVLGIQKRFSDVQIVAPEKNRRDIPFATTYVTEGDRVLFQRSQFQVMELPGHTLGHIAFSSPADKMIFSGDVLFGLGCGRLFEGTPEMAFESLNKFKSLSAETQIYCTHEYTETNCRFVNFLKREKRLPIKLNTARFQQYELELQAARAKKLPSVPLKLSNELLCNPFLTAADLGEFTRLRQLRNDFR